MAETPMGIPTADQALSSVAIPTDGLSSSPASPEHDDDVDRLRGIVVLPYRRKILFSDEVELDVGTLPRWRPQIRIDERRLTDDDDE
jgi:hypothetical protein